MALLVVLAVVATAVIATIPYVLANSRIKDSIRHELEQLTGVPVKLGGEFSVSVLPSFVASMSDVEIGEPAGSGKFSARAKSIDVEMSWLAALSRRVEIKALKIDQAEFDLTETPSGSWIPEALGATLTPRVSLARMALSNNPEDPDFSAVANWNIQRLLLTNVRLTLLGRQGARNVISGINAELGWPGSNSPLTFSGAGDWRGAKVNLAATVAKPLMAAAGGNTEFAMRLDAEPVQFEFDGIANLQNFFFTDGKLRFETPSMERLLSWLGTEIEPGNSVGQMSMAARLTTKDDQLKFSEVLLEVEGNKASGVLDLSRAMEVPALSGTLAFEELDLASFMRAFSTGPATRNGAGSLGYLDQFQLDLRLSAATARIGPLGLKNLAAAVRVKDGSADFDLGDASALGGRLQASLKMMTKGERPLGEMRLRATDVDLSQIEGLAGMPVILAPVQLELTLNGLYSGLEAFLASGTGEAEISAAAGQIGNFDLAKLREALDRRLLFNLPSVYSGSTVMESAKLAASVEKGVAVVKDGTIKLAGAQLVVSGALPLKTRGLALTGDLTSKTDGETLLRQHFFVGGSWSQPFVTPAN